MQVLAYTSENLKQIYQLILGDSWSITARHESFGEYFTHPDIDVKVFLIEDDYIDRDYITDYSTYFATCFHDYGRWCKRIHLFSFDFTKNDFDNNLRAANKNFIENLQKNYKGFIVVRPIPAHIGKTCLATYSNDPIRGREYPVTNTYYVNLYGIELSVVSLAYQEQDGSVAVCASSALWSALNRTGQQFHHKIPSPAQVTQLATSESHIVRNLPNNGLTAEQLGVGITALGLEPQIYTLASAKANKAIIYAYLKAGIPVICGLKLFKMHTDNHLEMIAEHAVTINGGDFGPY